MSAPMLATPRSGRQHAAAVLQALFVTFLWSTSWVLIKVGLEDLDLGPISFAGLRYALAAIVLLPFGIRAMRVAGGPLPAPMVGRVAAYGILFITVAQGAQYAALGVLPATAVSLILSFIPAVVALLALLLGRERASVAQLGGIGMLTVGAVLYFGPFEVPPASIVGFVAAAGCVLASAVSSHLGRDLARAGLARIGGSVGLTALSIALGGAVLLVAGVAIDGWPALDGRGWLIIGWLAVVNTAFAFTLWNHTLRTLTAVESSVVNNTMTIQIAVLAIVVLGETLAPMQLVGLLLAAAGAAVVQLGPTLALRDRGRGPMGDRSVPDPSP